MFPTTCPVCKHDSLEYDEQYIYCTNCSAYRKPLRFYQRPLAWSAEKWGWWWRAAVLAWFVIMLGQNLHDYSFALDRTSNPFSALDLGIHELGHMLFIPFGEFMRILGGSLFQCLFPLLWVAGFLQIRWYFGAAMCWCWLGLNLFDVATYAGDAQNRILPLATGFAGISEQSSEETYNQGHDWYQLLSRTGRLSMDQTIAHSLRIAAVIAFCIGLTIGAILLIYMFRGAIRRFVAKRVKEDTAEKDKS